MKTHISASAASLEHALANVPFYQGWQVFDPGPANPLEQRYAALPVLTKRDIRAHMPKGFVPRDRNFQAGLASGEVELVTTSGTTEDRSSIVWYQPWWDGSEQAAATLYTGLERVVTGRQREAVLTTPLCAGAVCHIGDLTLEERTLGRLLFLNQQPDPNRWLARDMDRMIHELDLFQPELLEADPAYLAILCRHAKQKGLSLYQPRFVTLTYEFPSRLYYQHIRAAFPHTPILSSYGSTEAGHVFTECEQGRFHQNTEFCHVDFQPLNPARGDASTGRILVTTIGNPWVSLLRFDIGDLVRLETGACPCGRCPCGRSLGLTVSRVLGRTRDLTFTETGRAVTVDELDQAVGEKESLTAYQMEQTGPRDFIFRYVAAAGHSVPVSSLETAFHSLYGQDARMIMRPETAIPAEQSGKYRLARTSWTWLPDDLFATGEEA